MIDKIPELDRAGLRQFGLMMAAVIAPLFGLLLPWLFGFAWPAWPWILSGVFALLALLYPLGLKPVYALWMRFGLVMGWINSRIILSSVFFVILLPVGLIMRVFGADPMARKLDASAQSYRTESKATRPDHMNFPY